MYGIKENQEQNLNKYERFKRFRVKSCRSISLPVKNMASGAPRGHITTGIFSTDKVVLNIMIKFNLKAGQEQSLLSLCSKS